MKDRATETSTSVWVFNVCGKGAVWVCVLVCICVKCGRRGCTVIEGQPQRKVGQWWSSRPLWVKLKSYRISVGLFVLPTEKAIDTFEHIFTWNKVYLQKGQGRTVTLPASRAIFLETLFRILLLFLHAFRRLVNPNYPQCFALYL